MNHLKKLNNFSSHDRDFRKKKDQFQVDFGDVSHYSKNVVNLMRLFKKASNRGQNPQFSTLLAFSLKLTKEEKKSWSNKWIYDSSFNQKSK